MRSVIFVSAIMCVCLVLAECKDGVCTLSAPSVVEAPQSAVQAITQSPRLKSLEGKTIAIVGGSFMASVTHPELKRLVYPEDLPKIHKLPEFAGKKTDIADPWYAGNFDATYDDILEGCTALLEKLPKSLK